MSVASQLNEYCPVSSDYPSVLNGIQNCLLKLIAAPAIANAFAGLLAEQLQMSSADYHKI